MSKHTPGPWRALDKSAKSRQYGIYNNAGNIVASGSTGGPVDQPRRLADAKLIAAAPDLLEALELLAYPSMGTIKGNGETHIGWQLGDGLTANERLAKARAAIRKATE